MSNLESAFDFAKCHLGEVERLNRHLIENFNFYLLSYRRVYKNGTILFFYGKREWLDLSFKENSLYLMGGTFTDRIFKMLHMEIHKAHYIYPFNPAETKDPVFGTLYKLNIWNGIDVQYNYKDYMDDFCFASYVGNTQIYDLYLNHSEILEYVTDYLKENLADSLKFPPPEVLVSYAFENRGPDLLMEQDGFKKFKNLFPLKQSKIILNALEFSVSTQEYRCFTLLCKGYSIKEIALELEVSPRTIETYLERIKDKTSIKTNSQLIKSFFKRESF